MESRLPAASGIADTNQDAVVNAAALFAHFVEHAFEHGVDARCNAAWSCSNNAPTTLSSLMREGASALSRAPKDAWFCYPFLRDARGSSKVAEASTHFGLVACSRCRSMNDIARDTSHAG
jgi:hypothetical protein